MQRLHVPPGLTPNTPPIRLSALAARCKQLHRNPINRIIAIAHSFNSCTDFFDIAITDKSGMPLAPWSAASAAIFASLYREQNIPIVPENTPTFNFPSNEHIHSILVEATGLNCDSISLIGSQTGDLNLSKLLFASRLICLHHSIQGNLIFRLARTLSILELHPLDENGFRTSSFHDHLFLEEFGCSALDYAFIIFCILANSTEHSLFNTNDFLRNSKISGNKLESLNKIIESISVSPSELRDLISNNIDSDIIEIDSVINRVFLATPLIRLNRTQYCIAPRPYIANNIGTGMWIKALELARKHSHRNGIQHSHTNIYNQRMSVAFVNLLKSLLKYSSCASNIHDEYKYDSKNSNDSSDIIACYGSCDDKIILFESKLRRLSIDTFLGHNEQGIDDDAQWVAEALRQVISFVNNLLTASFNNTLRPESLELSRKIISARKIIPCIIVPSCPHLFMTSWYRNRVEEKLRSILTNDELSHFNNNKKLKKWVLIDSEDVHIYASLDSHISLFDWIDRYTSEDKFGRWITNKGAMQPLGRYMLQNYNRHFVPPLPHAIRAFNNFHDYVQKRFLGRDIG